MKHASWALGFLCGALLFLGGCSDSQDIDGPLLAFPEGEGFAYPMEIGTNPMAALDTHAGTPLKFLSLRNFWMILPLPAWDI